jgi:hypothetical protein
MANEPAVTSVAAVHDRRERPRGVLPRQVQVWLMAGLATVIVLVILIAGHSQPPPPGAGAGRATTTTLADADRIRAYQQQLADDEARLRQVQRNAMATPQSAASGERRAVVAGERADPSTDEARRRDYQSLSPTTLHSRAEGASSRRP